ncbi:MAG TPA: hypothetical protein DCQ50_09695 [Chryseobacterium sp.]|nr:hypothetical protein [Chryseobacterium sp.]
MKKLNGAEALFLQLETFYEISREVRHDLLPLLEEKNFLKNEVILSRGNISEYVYFLISGCVRFNYLNDKNEDITTFFVLEDEFFANSSSFLTGEPSLINITAIEPTETLRLHKSQVQLMYSKHPDFEKVARGIIEKTLVGTVLRSPPIILSAEERYLRLLEKNPEFVKRIPVKYLATYLGIHPNSLSRIRRDMKL